MHAAERLREVVRRGRNRDRTAGRDAAGIRERRDVYTQAVAPEARVEVPAVSIGDHTSRRSRDRKHAAAERERARDDAPATVEHLRQHLCPAGGRVERPRFDEERRRRRAQLSDRNGAPAQ